jgi:CubicO group peptidase (beta-lactamase class C family)
MLAEKNQVYYHYPVNHYWKEFKSSTCTVSHLLSHQAGLANSVSATTPTDDLCNWDKMIAQVASAEPAHAPGAEAHYHYLSFGWLVAGLVQKISKRHIRDMVREDIAKPLGIQDEFFMGLPSQEEDDEAAANATSKGDEEGDDDSAEARKTYVKGVHKRVATLCNGFGKDGAAPTRADIVATIARLKRLQEEKKPKEETKGAEAAATVADDEKGTASGTAAAAATAAADNDGFSDGLNLMADSSWLDPLLFNTKKLRTACIPAANGHFSARALAKFYNALAGGAASQQQDEAKGSSSSSSKNVQILSPERIDSVREVQVLEHSPLQTEPIRWGLGFRVYGLQDKKAALDATRSSTMFPDVSSAERKAAAVRYSAFGHSGLGGSFAFCDPDSGLSVAITVNLLTLPKALTSRLMKLICDETIGCAPTSLA